MDQEDHHHLNGVEEGTHQDGCNPLKSHFMLLKCQEILGSQRDNNNAYYMLAMTVVPSGMKKSR
jgi:hypothetical protein